MFLDIPITVGLTPDLCVVNNNWHDNAISRIFLSKYIRFVPTQAGKNSLPELLKPYTEAGSSVLIFPEGDLNINKIGRFRKGAFFLAQELGLPIQPVLIMYSQQLFEKRWFFFKSGEVFVKYLDPVFPGSNLYNSDYQITTKNINLLMKEAFEELKKESFN
jgi:1-acyl-sn-glycerol-3-phosphate acyltransferase